MVSKENVCQALILMALLSFGFIGSLSHLFNLALICVFLSQYQHFRALSQIEQRAKIIFLALTGVFFIFLIRSMFNQDFIRSFISLSPMFPIPLIGLLILFQKNSTLRLSTASLAFFSKLSIFTSFLVFLIISQKLGQYYRLELFSGNPIPFSIAVFGISIFSLCNWVNSNKRQKIIAVLFLLLGIYISGFLSGARGTLLSIIISAPFLFWFIARSYIATIALTSGMIISIILIWYLNNLNYFEMSYFRKIISGVETILSYNNLDRSIHLKLKMWEAAVETIKNAAFFGHDISNRFMAIVPNLPNGFSHKFSHPHNDILASIIGTGFIGGVLSIFCISSPLLAAYLSTEDRPIKFCLAVPLVINIFCSANVNTVFFNDISSAWLAFSTFLIWNIRTTSESNNCP